MIQCIYHNNWFLFAFAAQGIELRAFILSHNPSPFYFETGALLSLTEFPGWTHTCNPFASASQIAGITDIHHQSPGPLLSKAYVGILQDVYKRFLFRSGSFDSTSPDYGSSFQPTNDYPLLTMVSSPLPVVSAETFAARYILETKLSVSLFCEKGDCDDQLSTFP